MQYFTTKDGLRLAFHDDDLGDGFPILCLPGLTRNSTDFEYVLPHLSGHRVIRPDYRGRGQSDWAPDPASYTISVETEDMLALLDHLRLDRVAVIGTSRGGLIAMAMAATAKNRLIGVALNDIGPVIDPTGMDIIRDYIGQPPPYADLDAFARAKAKLTKGFDNVSDARWREEAARQARETPEGLALTYDPDLALNVRASAGQPLPDLWPLFDAMEGLPLALVRGANSDLLSLDTVAEMQRRRPDMIYANVPGRAHVPFLDEPEALSALHQWMSKCQ